MVKVGKPDASGAVRVTFSLPDSPPTGGVSVVGDFNDWDPYAHPMRRRGNGSWSAVVTVPVGSTLRFRYLADGGRWFDDESVGSRDRADALIAV